MPGHSGAAGRAALPALGIFAFLCSASAASPPVRLAIVGATVVHPERPGPPAADANTTVIISGNRITAVGPPARTPVPPGATVLDGRGKWVIPGLIDSHVHLFQSALYIHPDVTDYTRSIPYVREIDWNNSRLDAKFRALLASGVTAVADLGGPFWNFTVREASRRAPAAPRVAVAGPLLSLVAFPESDYSDPPVLRAATREVAVALAEVELRHRPEYIKVWFVHRPGEDLAAQEVIIRSIGAAAHRAGVRLAVHAMQLEEARTALRAGADLLVHSVVDRPVDEQFLALARKNRAVYIPTLFAPMGYALVFSCAWKPTEAEKRLADPQALKALRDLQRLPDTRFALERAAGQDLPLDLIQQMMAAKQPRPSAVALSNLRKVQEAGIPVALGTDAGSVGTLHGPSVFREIQLMAEAGLTPLDALRSATVNGAAVLGMANDLGAVAAGKLADLVILDADPLADIGNLSRVFRVIRNGLVFDPQALAASSR